MRPTGLAYDERLRVPWTWWLLGGVSLGIFVDIFDTTLIIGAVAGVWRAVCIAFFVIVFVSGMVSWSLTRVAVTDAVLLAAGERLPLRSIGRMQPVDDATRRRLMGPHGNRLAHLATRPWVKTALVLESTDPADPAPYWLVSTRRPEALAAAITAAQQPRPAVPEQLPG